MTVTLLGVDITRCIRYITSYLCAKSQGINIKCDTSNV